MSHHQAAPRIAVMKVQHILPPHYVEALEQNQQIASCCRHPENHEIEAIYSNEAQRDSGVPDIYVFHCTCGRAHRRFCVGGSAGSGTTQTEARPKWTVR